jgi:hypothetical protein
MDFNSRTIGDENLTNGEVVQEFRPCRGGRNRRDRAGEDTEEVDSTIFDNLNARTYVSVVAPQMQ